MSEAPSTRARIDALAARGGVELESGVIVFVPGTDYQYEQSVYDLLCSDNHVILSMGLGLEMREPERRALDWDEARAEKFHGDVIAHVEPLYRRAYPDDDRLRALLALRRESAVEVDVGLVTGFLTDAETLDPDDEDTPEFAAAAAVALAWSAFEDIDHGNNPYYWARQARFYEALSEGEERSAALRRERGELRWQALRLIAYWLGDVAPA